MIEELVLFNVVSNNKTTLRNIPNTTNDAYVVDFATQEELWDITDRCHLLGIQLMRNVFHYRDKKTHFFVMDFDSLNAQTYEVLKAWADANQSCARMYNSNSHDGVNKFKAHIFIWHDQPFYLDDLRIVSELYRKTIFGGLASDPATMYDESLVHNKWNKIYTTFKHGTIPDKMVRGLMMGGQLQPFTQYFPTATPAPRKTCFVPKANKMLSVIPCKAWFQPQAPSRSQYECYGSGGGVPQITTIKPWLMPKAWKATTLNVKLIPTNARFVFSISKVLRDSGHYHYLTFAPHFAVRPKVWNSTERDYVWYMIPKGSRKSVLNKIACELCCQAFWMNCLMRKLKVKGWNPYTAYDVLATIRAYRVEEASSLTFVYAKAVAERWDDVCHYPFKYLRWYKAHHRDFAFHCSETPKEVEDLFNGLNKRLVWCKDTLWNCYCTYINDDVKAFERYYRKYKNLFPSLKRNKNKVARSDKGGSHKLTKRSGGLSYKCKSSSLQSVEDVLTAFKDGRVSERTCDRALKKLGQPTLRRLVALQGKAVQSTASRCSHTTSSILIEGEVLVPPPPPLRPIIEKQGGSNKIDEIKDVEDLGWEELFELKGWLPKEEFRPYVPPKTGDLSF